MRPTARLVTLCLVCISAAACQQDSVQPSLMGPQAGAGGSVVGPITGDAGRAGSSGGAMSAGSGVAGTSAGTAGGIEAGSGGTGGMVATAGAGGDGGSGGTGGMPSPGGGACDVSGRWLSTVHAVTDAIGQLQTTHFFIYYEIERQGDGYAITKGLHCGDDAKAVGDFAVSVDFVDSWPEERKRISYAGRSVSSTQAAGGCDVRFGRAYTVRGATVAHYQNPANPMPTAAQQANGTMPGWEDWDGDGQPGITGYLTGTVTGKVFVAPRHWTELSGTVPDTMTSFRLPLLWEQEPNVMAYDPPEDFLLGSTSSRAGDPSLHFGEFARLADGQATGDDNAICDAVIELVPTLTPAAGAI